MKHIKKYLLSSCTLTVLLVSLVYVFAIIANPEITPAIEFSRYFTILIFSFLTVGANSLFAIPRLPKILALAIHYLVIFGAFMFIFVDLSTITAPKIFTSIMIYTTFYAIIFCISIGINKLSSHLDKSIKKKELATSPKEVYKPRYK